MTNPYAADLSSWMFLTFFLGTMLHSMITGTLDWLDSEKGNLAERVKRLHLSNPLLRKHFPRRRIDKALRYNDENSRFSDFADSLGSVVMTVSILLGLIPTVLDALLGAGLGMTLSLIAITTAGTLVSTALSIPFAMYRTFGIEERNGFNRTTRSVFFRDILKSVVLGCAFNSVLIFLGNLIFSNIRFSWSNVLPLVLGFVLFRMAMEFLSFPVMRMFFRFEPMKDRTLLRKLETVFSNAGYAVKNVLVMDGSSRSTHSNAFVCGVGKSKRIVLYDTLLKRFTHDEIASVLAHEIGHAKKGHLLVGRILGTLGTSVFALLVVLFLYDVDLYRSFGFSYVTQENVRSFSLLGLVLVSMTFRPVKAILLDPLMAFVSRKMEYQADSEAKRYMKTGKHLASALVKISSENLSDPFPSGIVESLTFDHPSLVNRLKALGDVKNVSRRTSRKKKKKNRTGRRPRPGKKTIQMDRTGNA